MPDHAKQVGVLCQRVIDLLGLSMTEGQSILLGESNIAHMVSRHPADFALYGEYIPLILAEPDYVALNAKDGSIEYVKEVQVNSAAQLLITPAVKLMPCTALIAVFFPGTFYYQRL